MRNTRLLPWMALGAILSTFGWAQTPPEAGQTPVDEPLPTLLLDTPPLSAVTPVIPLETSPSLSLREMAETPGPLTTEILPSVQTRADLGIRLDAMPLETHEALGPWFDWGNGPWPDGGMIISYVEPRSDAQSLGVRTGDVLVAMEFGQGGQQNVRSFEDFDLAMDQIAPNDLVRLTLYRRGIADVRAYAMPQYLATPREDGSSLYWQAWRPEDWERFQAQQLDGLRRYRMNGDLLGLKDRADMALVWKQYAQAAEEYQALLETWSGEPKPYPALFGLAHALRMAGWFDEAAEAIRQALAANPTSAMAAVEQARILIALGRHGEAAEALVQAKALAPPTARDLRRQIDALESHLSAMSRATTLPVVSDAQATPPQPSTRPVLTPDTASTDTVGQVIRAIEEIRAAQ